METKKEYAELEKKVLREGFKQFRKELLKASEPMAMVLRKYGVMYDDELLKRINLSLYHHEEHNCVVCIPPNIGEGSLPHSILEIFIKKIRLALTKPLHSTVKGLSRSDGLQTNDVRGLGFVRRGTMLFLGIDATQDSVLLQGAKKASKKAWSITYKFKEHPYGWNYIYTGKPDVEAQGALPSFGWIPIVGKILAPVAPDLVGLVETLYTNSDFNNFLPPITSSETTK